MKVEVVITGMMVVLSAAENTEVYLAVAFVHLTLDINLTLKTPAVLKLHQDYLTIKLLFNNTVTPEPPY